MRKIKFWAIALLSFLTVTFGSVLFKRVIAVTLCGILGMDSSVCYFWGGVSAAQPPNSYEIAQVDIFRNDNSSPQQTDIFRNDGGNSQPSREDIFQQPNQTTPNQTAPNSEPSQPTNLTPGNSGISNEPCNPTLLTASARPATQVIVKGVPTSFDNSNLQVKFKDTDTKKFVKTVAIRREDGDLGVVVPIHPANKEGGIVQLTIATLNQTCPVISLQIEPLPEAPGTTKEVFADLQRNINEVAQIYGINPSQLRGDVEQQPSELQGIALAQLFLDHPSNPNSFKAILDGTAPILEGQELDLNILDNLIASSGLLSSINDYLADLIASEKKTVNLQEKDYLQTRQYQNRLNKFDEKFVIAKQLSPQKKECREIDTVIQLKDAIIEYKSAKKSQEELLNKIAMSFFNAFSSAIVGLASGAAIADPEPITKVVLTAISASLAYTLIVPQVMYDRKINILPNRLTSLNFEVTNSKFTKISSESKEYTPSKGKWLHVKLISEGDTWKLNISQLFDLLAPLLSSINSIEATINLASIFNGIIQPFKKFPGVGSPAGPCKYEVMIDEVSSITWVEPSVDQSNVITLNGDNTYKPVGAGKVTLKLQTKPDAFGGEIAEGSYSYITVEDDDDDDEPNPEPSGNGRSSGDPHLTTFDGLRYDHHGVGEFILTKSNDGRFEVQVREAASLNSRKVAQNVAAAVKVGSDRVAFYLDGFPDSDTSNRLRVNGQPATIPGNSLSLSSGGKITKLGRDSYLVESPTGERVGVSVGQFGGVALLNIQPLLPESRKGQMVGLLGNFNGNPNDDLKTRNGQVIPPQESINQVREITRNLTNFIPIPLEPIETAFLEKLHKQFGDSWRISQEESLFDYAPGKNTESFTNRSFPNGFIVLRMLAPQQIQEAERVCRQAGLENDLFEECLFDVGATGNADFAKAAVNALTNEIRNRVEEEIRDRIPVPGGLLRFP
ncbi:MAG: hypothetical protein F6K45_21940 [Kamptonema sp. SIO1D9]|nr:hypothetical protein [Kamptonema sp. SIO1D9]